MPTIIHDILLCKKIYGCSILLNYYYCFERDYRLHSRRSFFLFNSDGFILYNNFALTYVSRYILLCFSFYVFSARTSSPAIPREKRTISPAPASLALLPPKFSKRLVSDAHVIILMCSRPPPAVPCPIHLHATCARSGDRGPNAHARYPSITRYYITPVLNCFLMRLRVACNRF